MEVNVPVGETVLYSASEFTEIILAMDRLDCNYYLQGIIYMYICYLVHLKACLYNFVTRPCYFTFLVHIVQLLNRSSKIHKNIGRKIEFREINFRDGANFNNFRRV